MRKRHVNRLKSNSWLIVDCFAGGGGASTGIERALNRSPDIAVNHNGEALAMHEANHPWTRHFKTDVREVDPMLVTNNLPVGLAWFSPDCTFFSKSRGGKPIRIQGKKVRGLAWVVVNWARKVRPRVIILENVEEFQDWCPVVQKLGTDGYPVFDEQGNPWYVPCPNRKGQTFRKWVRRMQRAGYVVEWRELRACDYGAPTIRKRLFVIARCDGEPIVWPEPTHGKPNSVEVQSGQRQPWRTAAEIIDWSLVCPSIFLTKEEGRAAGVNRPLKENTMKRIAKGLFRYVINAQKPFIVSVNHGDTGGRREYPLDDPFRTVTASKGDGVVDVMLNPVLTEEQQLQADDSRIIMNGDEPPPFEDWILKNQAYGGSRQQYDAIFGIAPYATIGQQGGSNRSVEEPVQTVTASDGDQNALVAPYLVPRYGEAPGQDPRCRSVEDPLPTIVTTDNGGQLVAPILEVQYSNSKGASVELPCPTVMAGTTKIALMTPVMTPFLASPAHSTTTGRGPNAWDIQEPVRTVLTSNDQCIIAPILDAYHGPKGDVDGRSAELSEPMRTQDTSNRHAMVQAFLAQHNSGMVGHHPAKPLSTITNRGAQQQVVAATMVGCGGRAGQSPPRGLSDPTRTTTAKADECLVAATMVTNTTGHGPTSMESPVPTQTTGNHHALVKAFIAKYYGNHHNHQTCTEPLHTATTKERFGIVTVDEIDYEIVDIGMRMLTARELFSAQGFPSTYQIDVWCDDRRNDEGKPLKPGFLTKAAQVRCAGNSVCPDLAAALVGANCPWLRVDPGSTPGERNRVFGEFTVRKPANAV